MHSTPMKTTRTIPNLFACKNAYDFGLHRGDATGRETPTDRDYSWLGQASGGRIQTDPQDGVAFAQGMRDGANNG